MGNVKPTHHYIHYPSGQEWLKEEMEKVAEGARITVAEAYRIAACEYWQRKYPSIADRYAKLKKLKGEK